MQAITKAVAKAHGLINYHEVIKKPMALETVKKKMDAGAYTNAELLYADLNQIVTNACL